MGRVGTEGTEGTKATAVRREHGWATPQSRDVLTFTCYLFIYLQNSYF